GRVLAFEPNPRAYELLRWHAEANYVSQITLMREGLSDSAQELQLQLPRWENLGAGTFCPLPARYHGVVAESCTAHTIRGDHTPPAHTIRADAPPALPAAGHLVINLAFEGFEPRALRGLERTVADRLPLIITELNRELLVASGSSPYELFQEMHARGYRGYGF